MNIKQLHYIMTIHREGSINKAAKKLYISQPALSQHLIKLENELGGQIFERKVTPIKLTHAGEEIIKIANEILFQNEQALKIMEDTNDLRRGKIKIGIPPNRAMQVLPFLLPEFSKIYPGIKIILVEQSASELENLILQHKIDFSFMVSASNYENIVYRHLFDEALFLAIPRHFERDIPKYHLNLSNPSVGFSFCAKRPFIAMKEGYRLRNIFNKHIAPVKPKIVLEVSSTGLAHRLAASGYGISLVSQWETLTSSFKEQLIYCSIIPQAIKWSMGICYHKDIYVSKVMGTFFDFAYQKLNLYPEQLYL